MREGYRVIQDSVMNIDGQVRGVLARADAIVAANRPVRSVSVAPKVAPVVTIQTVRAPERRKAARRVHDVVLHILLSR